MSLKMKLYSNLLVTFLTILGRHVLFPLTQFLSIDLIIIYPKIKLNEKFFILYVNFMSRR